MAARVQGLVLFLDDLSCLLVVCRAATVETAQALGDHILRNREDRRNTIDDSRRKDSDTHDVVPLGREVRVLTIKK